MTEPVKRKVGRPPEGNTVKVKLPPDVIVWLDRQGKNRSETIRRIIDRQMHSQDK